MSEIERWTLRWVEPNIAPNDPIRPNALVVGPTVRWHGREVEVVSAEQLERAVSLLDDLSDALAEVQRGELDMNAPRVNGVLRRAVVHVNGSGGR